MRLLRKVIGKEWSLFAVLIAMGAISGGLYTWTIKLIHTVLGEGITLLLLLQIVGFASFSAISAIYAGRRMTKLYERNISALRVDLSRKVMQAKYEQIESRSKMVVPVLMNEVHALTNFVKSLPAAVVAFFQFSGILIYMFWLSFQFASMMLVIFGVLFLFNFAFLSRLYTTGRAASTINHSLHHSIEGLIKGIKELVLNKKHNESYIQHVIKPKSDQFADKQAEISSINITLSKISEWIVIVSLSCLLLIVQKYGTIDSDRLVQFFTLLLFLLPSLITITSFFRSFKKMQVSVDKIEELGLSFSQEITSEAEDLKQLKEDQNGTLIDLKDIVYHYTMGQNSFGIGPMSMSIRKNEILCITGGNGSGKTTLLKLLIGLYQGASGTISFNGTVVEESNLQQYRNQFSVSFADSFVFQDLSYLQDSTLLKKSAQLIDMLELQDKISMSDLSISDIDLSFGQRGRLNLLRTILEDKPIIVFDEWAANQDPSFKRKFYHEILPILKAEGKTIILVSHDDNYYEVADRIVKLSEGKIVDSAQLNVGHEIS